MAEFVVDSEPQPWTGRDDGPGPEHARWHSVMRLGCLVAGGATLLGFASDEGVRRNQGQVGAAEGPSALRAALASLSAPGIELSDAGDIAVTDRDLAAGQQRLGSAVAAILDADALPVVLGGGHAVAYGSYLGWASRAASERWGILNIDAHFDLRAAPEPTSGTPFRQAAEAELAAGRALRYGVVGINRASNTAALFQAADEYGVDYLEDDQCGVDQVRSFVQSWLVQVERVHLTIDLDALPASVAPGVSAPAGFGIGLDAVRAAVATVCQSGKLGVVEIAELNPRFDLDARTSRTAARLIDEALRTHFGTRPTS